MSHLALCFQPALRKGRIVVCYSDRCGFFFLDWTHGCRWVVQHTFSEKWSETKAEILPFLGSLLTGYCQKTLLRNVLCSLDFQIASNFCTLTCLPLGFSFSICSFQGSPKCFSEFSWGARQNWFSCISGGWLTFSWVTDFVNKNDDENVQTWVNKLAKAELNPSLFYFFLHALQKTAARIYK